MLNSRVLSTTSLHPHTPAAAPPYLTGARTNGGILKKAGCACTRAEGGKKISFNKETRVTLVSPMPEGYHGMYTRMAKDEV
ncbi:MAG: hypothetical protein LQ340_008092, partial [Diploschistes diacapsis]